MALFNFFGRRPPVPASSIAPVQHAPIALARAPSYQPLPTNSADPVDAEVVRLWAAHQRQSRDTSWHGFITALAKDNLELAEQVKRANDQLADYRRIGVFKP